MNNIQSVAELKNITASEAEIKQAGMRRINFKAENDSFVRQSQSKSIQPMILQQDPRIQMLEKQQKEEKKRNFTKSKWIRTIYRFPPKRR